MCAGFLLFYYPCTGVIDFSILEHYNPGKPSIVLDDEGNEWARFQLDKREPITLAQMPPHLIHAFLAAEDWSFFQHSGLSWKGIIRSTLVNLYYGRRAQGASTITQQLVRLLFFDAQKTFTRKIKEQLFALIVECQFSKEQILETYLNHVFFGCGIYGVEAACQRFWGKHAWETTIDEAAVLAAIMRSPNRYCPLINPLSAQRRRDIILHSMLTLKFITQEQYEESKKVSVTTKQQDNDICAPHLKEMIRLFMEDTVGKKALYSEGLVIQTTLNRTIQQRAQEAFNKQFALLRTTLMPDVDGALLSLDVKTGEIKALIGGVDFAVSKFNRALQARRQMGSTFKPLIYTVALEQGMHFSDRELDAPLELVQHNGTVWSPNNSSLKFNGWMTLAWALSNSNNIIAIKTFLKLGAHPIIELAQRCHLKGPFSPYPSLALGCVDVTLVEVAAMFNIFANDGIYVEPHYIRWVKDSIGRKIWRCTTSQERVISSIRASQVAKVLEIGLHRLRARKPQEWIDAQAISKTGTTNDSRTCWFTGSTPELTTALYVGRDDNKPMGKNIFPIRTAFPIWIDLYRALPWHQKAFMYNPALHEVSIDDRTGCYSNNQNDPHAITIFEL